MSRFRLVLFASLAALAPLSAQSTILTFTETFGDGIDSYGDRVVGSPQAGATYLEGDGWTPNVELNFVVPSTAPSLWATGYAGNQMPWALGHSAFDVPFRLEFVPDAGYQVTLHGFEIGTWASGSYQTDIRVWDEAGSFDQPNLFASDSLLVPNTVYLPLTGPLTGQGTLHLYLNNLGSTGLDNIHFSQSLVPEPASLALMGLGISGVLLAARRRPARSAHRASAA